MTEGAEGCSDDPLASLQLDVASGGPSTENQQPESQAEVSTLCISSADDDDIDKIIAGEWHGGECKSMYAVCELLCSGLGEIRVGDNMASGTRALRRDAMHLTPEKK